HEAGAGAKHPRRLHRGSRGGQRDRHDPRDGTVPPRRRGAPRGAARGGRPLTHTRGAPTMRRPKTHGGADSPRTSTIRGIAWEEGTVVTFGVEEEYCFLDPD